MLRFLFPGLTDTGPRGTDLFARVVDETRAPVWYVDLGVPDTMDGRFGVLASVTALTLVRLERGGDQAQQAGVALTERFIESMDHEHRQLGYGDPTIGKIVRKLTASLARRVERMRTAVDEDSWGRAAAASVWGPQDPDAAMTKGLGDAMSALWKRLQRTDDERLIEGEWA